MLSLNKVMLIGRVGKTPTLSTTSGNIHYTKLSIATTNKYKNKETGEYDSTWHYITAWRILAELCVDRLKTGSLVYIEGELSKITYTKEGETKPTILTQITANEVVFLEKKDKSNYDSNSEHTSAFDPTTNPTTATGLKEKRQELPLIRFIYPGQITQRTKPDSI